MRPNGRAARYVVSCVDHFGLLAGFIGSKPANRRGEGMILEVILGIVGAIVRWLFSRFGVAGVTGSNLYSLLSRWLALWWS